MEEVDECGSADVEDGVWTYRAKSAGFIYTQSPHQTLIKISVTTIIAHQIIIAMAPQLSEDEIDDLIYFSRAGENDELVETLTALADREKVTPAEILVAARDESNKSTTLHMATGNGHLGMASRSENMGEFILTCS